jgi:hypothetical protein
MIKDAHLVKGAEVFHAPLLFEKGDHSRKYGIITCDRPHLSSAPKMIIISVQCNKTTCLTSASWHTRVKKADNNVRFSNFLYLKSKENPADKSTAKTNNDIAVNEEGT